MRIPEELNEDLIPPGIYCYQYMDIDEGKKFPPILCCPYWDIKEDKPKQMNGYCHFEGIGDWEEDSFGFLWDQCKSCCVKYIHSIDDVEDRNSEEYKEEIKKYYQSILDWVEKVIAYEDDEEKIKQAKLWIDKLKTYVE